MDGGERKRRKIGSEEGGQDGGGDGADEEKKMETFFALIRSAKEVLQSLAREPPRKRARLDEEEWVKKAAVWTPTFQLEDFAGDYMSLSGRVPGVQAGPSNSEGEEEEDGKAKREKQKEDDDLDLKLSL